METFAAPESLSTFQQSIPLKWIEQALESTQKFSIRRRKLPAELGGLMDITVRP
ncbi:transposase domain-containing protein [Xenorhabdus sp. SGI240]|uniref:transposase domain-containing protein n=1 Tax=Xenorhabdus sp. SGI240 TaxID=3158262 RepID=UPI0032B800D1